MAASIIDILAEESRQLRTSDEFYYRKLPWVFRLKVEGGSFVGPTGQEGEAVFHLPIAPDQFDYDLPYAVELSPQQEGGVISEEAGFIVGEIRISATTGYKLRPDRSLTFSAEGGRFTGLLGTPAVNFDDLSGQMHFWLLAQRCFEGYSQLKKDPEHGPNTRLELHVMKDDLHLEVIPRRFKITRSAAKERVTYRYEITLSVIGEAEDVRYEAPDERDLFDKIGDTLSAVRQGAQSISAAITDLSAAIGELSRFASGIAGLIDDLKGIVDSATSFVTGTKSFFDIPAAALDRVVGLVESTAALLEEAESLPADVYQSLMGVNDSLDAIKVAARDHFQESWSQVAEKYNAETEPGFGEDVSDPVQAEIDDKETEAAESQGLMTVDSAFGGAVKPGDKQRQGLSAAQRRLAGREYSGFAERVVGQGDTVQSLAAKHLGDARKWLDLVIVNRLQPPYITNGARVPHTLTVGDNVIVPIAKPSRPPNVLTAGQAPTGSSQAEAHLGTDIELVKLPGRKNRWGWAVDTAHGSVDCTKVRGVECLAQGLAVRLRTTRGENVLFPRLGMPRLVGAQQLGDDKIEARFRAREQILADPRVERLLQLTFEAVDDSIRLNARVQPVGFNSARTISRMIT